jgi:hypothetical protein
MLMRPLMLQSKSGFWWRILQVADWFGTDGVGGSNPLAATKKSKILRESAEFSPVDRSVLSRKLMCENRVLGTSN